MLRRRSSMFVFLLAVVCQPFTAAQPAAGRAITETDLFRFVWIADPQISPDGSRVAFLRVTVDEKKTGYDTALFIVEATGGEPRPFTAGPRDSSPRWSPDGKWIAFLRSPAPAQAGQPPSPPQIHLIPAAGGEAFAITDLPKGAGDPSWSPDSRRLVFTSTTSTEDLAKKKEKPDPSARVSDVRVIARAVYRFNGQGFSDPTRPAHVWTVDVPATAGAPAGPKPVTTGTFGEQRPAFSPDGQWIYFTSSHVKEPYYEPPKVDLWRVAAAGGEPEKVTSIEGGIGGFALSDDGRRVVFQGSLSGTPIRSYSQPDLFVADTAPGSAPRNLTAAYDYDVGSGLTGDQRAPRGGMSTLPVWSKDGRSVLVVTGEQGRANLMRIDVASGKVESFTRGNQEILAFTATPDRSRLAVLISTPTAIGDLHLADAGGQLTRITDVNRALFSAITITEPEEIWYTSFDGRKIQAWVQKPPDFDGAKKYPLILNIHGGPHAAYGYTFDHEFQWMAARGYVVLYPNPRGSTTYGQEFGNIIQFRYPGDDHKDLMAGVDEVIRRGYVDPARLGITGGSGGGVLTNWAITQTDRFAAAVSQRSIADWAGFWYTADFALFQPTWFRAAPWADPKDFAARSPITFVSKVKTPLMLIEGEADLRTPPSDGGEQMFRALKYMKVPTVMVRFPGESHELSRSGQPWHRIERLQHIVGWFDVYLQGQKTDTYDVK